MDTAAQRHRDPIVTPMPPGGGRTARALMPLLLAGSAWAAELPGGATITRGQATVTPQGTGTTIRQTSDRVEIDWQTFSVGLGRQVEFVQPGRSSIAINRVTGAEASRIQGAIRSNGQIFLINPNGILFSSSATVNVGALLASTRDLSDLPSLPGAFRLQGSSTATVINQGQLTAAAGGFLALVAARIENLGRLSAPGGSVLLGAGNRLTLNIGGPLKLGIDQGALEAQIHNGGAILAQDGHVLLTAKALGELSASVIRNTGSIEASSLSRSGGKVMLLAARVDNHGSVRADGATGGGEVLLGGDWQGSRAAELGEADRVTLAPGSVVSADATRRGEGGKVVAWSNLTDGVTLAAGRISARGGPQGGHGGRVETSGHRLDVTGLRVDAAAPGGRAGTWLLDPFDYTIDTAAASAIVASLDSGTSVTVTTASASGPGAGAAGAGDITVAAPIEKTAGGDASLTLQADRNIVLDAGIRSTSGRLDVALLAGGSVSGSTGAINTLGGTLSIQAAGSGTVANPIEGSTAVSASGTGTTTLSGGNSYSGGTTVAGGAVRVGSASALGAGPVTVSSGASLDLNGQTLSGVDLLTVSGTGAAGAGALTNSAPGTATVAGQIALGADATINGASGAIALTSVSAIAGSGRSLTLAGNSGGTLAGSLATGTGGLTKLGSGVWTLSGSNSHAGATSVGAGSLVAGSTSAFGAQSAVTVAGGATLDLAGFSNTVGSLAGGGTVTSQGGAATLTTGGNGASTGFSGSLQNGSGTLALTKTGSGTLTLTGSNSYSGTTTVQAGTLQVGAATRLGTGPIGVDAGATLLFNTSGYHSGTPIAGNLSGAGTVRVTGASTSRSVSFTGDNAAFSGTLQVDASSRANLRAASAGSAAASFVVNGLLATESTGATFQLGALSGTGTVSLGGGTTHQVLVIGGNHQSTQFAGNIGNCCDSISLEKVGSGTLTLASTQTYTGTTTIRAGTLQVGTGGTTGALRNGAIINHGTLVFARSDNVSIANTVSGTGQLVQSGGGTLTLTGSNSYTGATTVSAGTLRAGSASAFGQQSATTVSSGTTLDTAGFSVALGSLEGGGAVTNHGAAATLTVGGNGASTTFGGRLQNGTGVLALSKTGAGTLVLTGNHTYTGATTIGAGTLQIGSGGATGSIASTSGITDHGRLVVDRSGDVTISGVLGTGALAGTGHLDIQTTGQLTVDRRLDLSAGQGNIRLSAGTGRAAGDTAGGDVVFAGTGAVATGGQGTISVFTGHADTAGIDARLTGAEASRRKTYGSSAITAPVAGGRNLFYRERPSLTVSGVTAHSKTYDGSTSATLDTSQAVTTGLVDGLTVTYPGTGTFNSANVAQATTVSFDAPHVGSSDGYAPSGQVFSAASQTSAGAGITRRGLTITATGAQTRYGDATSLGGFSVEGLVAGETVGMATLETDALRSGAGHWRAGQWTIHVRDARGGTADLGNYRVSYAAGTLRVSRRPLAVDGALAADKFFDGSDTATVLGGSASRLAGDAIGIAVATGRFPSPSPGRDLTVSTTYTLAGADAGNYRLLQPQGLRASILLRPSVPGAASPRLPGGASDGSLLDLGLTFVPPCSEDDETAVQTQVSCDGRHGRRPNRMVVVGDGVAP